MEPVWLDEVGAGKGIIWRIVIVMTTMMMMMSLTYLRIGAWNQLWIKWWFIDCIYQYAPVHVCKCLHLCLWLTYICSRGPLLNYDVTSSLSTGRSSSSCRTKRTRYQFWLAGWWTQPSRFEKIRRKKSTLSEYIDYSVCSALQAFTCHCIDPVRKL